jgi:hypothetical protein
VQWPQSTQEVFGYIRQTAKEEILVLLNMSEKVVDCLDGEGGVVYSTHPSVEWTEKGITLQPHQGVIVRRDPR